MPTETAGNTSAPPNGVRIKPGQHVREVGAVVCQAAEDELARSERREAGGDRRLHVRSARSSRRLSERGADDERGRGRDQRDRGLDLAVAQHALQVEGDEVRVGREHPAHDEHHLRTRRAGSPPPGTRTAASARPRSAPSRRMPPPKTVERREGVRASRVDPNPCCSPLLSPKMSDPIAIVTVIAPPLVSSGRAPDHREPRAASAARPGGAPRSGGMFTRRKIDRQPRYCVSTPPATIPAHAARRRGRGPQAVVPGSALGPSA